jgi:hypothetical protein
VQQGLKGLQSRIANHCRNQCNVRSSFKLDGFSGSDNKNWYSHEHAEQDSHDDDSGISLQDNSQDRLPNCGGSSLPPWQDLFLRPEISFSFGEAARTKPASSSLKETLNTNREKMKENLDPLTPPEIRHPFRKAIEASSEPSNPRIMSTPSQHALHWISLEDTGIEKQRDQSTLSKDLGTTGHCKPCFSSRCNISTNIY